MQRRARRHCITPPYYGLEAGGVVGLAGAGLVAGGEVVALRAERSSVKRTPNQGLDAGGVVGLDAGGVIGLAGAGLVAGAEAVVFTG